MALKATPSPTSANSGRSERVPLEHFDGRRFVPLDPPPPLLDHRGLELILIGAGASAGRDLGVDLADDAESAAQRTLIDDLRIGRRHRLLEPLFAGEWR